MAKYLDPKADLTFKKVFGEHPDLVISLLNALLPFTTAEEYITSVQYLNAEPVPENLLRKNNIMDVRCIDSKGRQFIVEIQMIWSLEFMYCVMFNPAKPYTCQLDRNEDFHLLEPVYSLNLVNDVFEKDVPEYYHYYRMVHEMYTDKVIDGLHLIFVELPKFRPHSMTEKKMQVLWLRYLTEIEESTRNAPQELLDNPEISKALTAVEESAYTDEQLLGYDKFWDVIRTEKTIFNSAVRRGREKGYAEGREQGRTEGLAEGLAEGRAEGLAEGRAEGRAEGERDKALAIARKMMSKGVPVEDIKEMTGLTTAEIEQLLGY